MALDGDGAERRAGARPVGSRPAARERRAGEEHERDVGGDRVAGQAEHERRRRRWTPNHVGLPGRSATRQNTSSTPLVASAGLTWSCGPTDTPPLRRRGRPRRAPARWRVGGLASSADAAAPRLARRPARPARAASAPLESWTWPGPERGARADELVAGRQDRDARARRAAHRCAAGVIGDAELGRAEDACRGQHHLARPQVLARVADVAPGLDVVAERDGAVGLGDELDLQDARRRPRAASRRSRSGSPRRRRPGRAPARRRGSRPRSSAAGPPRRSARRTRPSRCWRTPGTSAAAVMSSASTRPSAAPTATSSAGSGRTSASTAARASSIESITPHFAESRPAHPVGAGTNGRRWLDPTAVRRAPRPVADAPVGDSPRSWRRRGWSR